MTSDAKYALITGGSRGIGRGIVLKLAETGVNVAVHYYQNQSAAESTLSQVRERGSGGFTVQADVRYPEDISRMFRQVQSEFGKLDIFVNNARPEITEFYQPPLDITLESWSNAIDSQARAFLVGTREAIGLMNDEGRIIAISYSPSGRTGSWQPWIGMGAAKAALDSLARYFAVALAQRRITVNIVSPGATDDSVFNGLPDEVFRAVKAWHESGWTPMGRMTTPADIGNAVALLCREEAGFITGQTLHVDGGASLMDPVLPLEMQRG